MDANALGDLIRRHAGLIHKVAFAYCRDANVREDVLQEIAVALWQSWDRYDPRYRESTFVYRIALNTAIACHRKERRHRTGRGPSSALAITVAATPEPGATEEARGLWRCIDALGALDKALVVLHLDGNDHAAIADVLGISVSNVGTRLLRVKTKLRTCMNSGASPEPKEESHGTR